MEQWFLRKAEVSVWKASQQFVFFGGDSLPIAPPSSATRFMMGQQAGFCSVKTGNF